MRAHGWGDYAWQDARPQFRRAQESYKAIYDDFKKAGEPMCATAHRVLESPMPLINSTSPRALAVPVSHVARDVLIVSHASRFPRLPPRDRYKKAHLFFTSKARPSRPCPLLPLFTRMGSRRMRCRDPAAAVL